MRKREPPDADLKQQVACAFEAREPHWNFWTRHLEELSTTGYRAVRLTEHAKQELNLEEHRFDEVVDEVEVAWLAHRLGHGTLFQDLET